VESFRYFTKNKFGRVSLIYYLCNMEILIYEATKLDLKSGLILVGIGLLIMVLWKKFFGDI